MCVCLFHFLWTEDRHFRWAGNTSVCVMPISNLYVPLFKARTFAKSHALDKFFNFFVFL